MESETMNGCFLFFSSPPLLKYRLFFGEGGEMHTYKTT